VLERGDSLLVYPDEAHCIFTPLNNGEKEPVISELCAIEMVLTEFGEIRYV
jgi:hypothetical protein